jgi:Glycogen recognition site of AMP-activated protein kinase
MNNDMTDLDSRLDAALSAMREPIVVPSGASARVAARAVLESDSAARSSTWWLRAAAAFAIVALGATALRFGAAADSNDERAAAESTIPVEQLASYNTSSAGTMVIPIAASSARPIVFEFNAPAAQSVQVLGDFNQWSRSTQTMQRSADGRWRVTTLLPPGRYVYAFLVDGARFERDPARDAIEDRDFGVTGSELVVGEAP